MDRLKLAKALAVLVPAGALAGAYGSQYWGGLVPCEMCWWQRYAHFAALALGLGAWLAGRGGAGRALLWLAALAIAISGGIGVDQAGVEWRWWEGFTQCTSNSAGLSGDELLRKIMNAPMVRCDQIQWSWLGISMAGWNGIVSIGSALVILWLSFTDRKGRA